MNRRHQIEPRIRLCVCNISFVTPDDFSWGSFPLPQPDELQWIISYAYATRRANSIRLAKEILLEAVPKFPGEAIIYYNLACYDCQLRRLDSAKDYLKKAFEIDSSWRLQALDDEDLKPLWDSL